MFGEAGGRLIGGSGGRSPPQLRSKSKFFIGLVVERLWARLQRKKHLGRRAVVASATTRRDRTRTLGFVSGIRRGGDDLGERETRRARGKARVRAGDGDDGRVHAPTEEGHARLQRFGRRRGGGGGGRRGKRRGGTSGGGRGGMKRARRYPRRSRAQASFSSMLRLSKLAPRFSWSQCAFRQMCSSSACRVVHTPRARRLVVPRFGSRRARC